MPDSHSGPATFLRALTPFVRRARVVASAWAIVMASATSALVATALMLAGASPGSVRLAAIGTLIGVATGAATAWSRHWTRPRVAADLERRAGGLDNLIVTAAEAAEGLRRPLHPVVAAPIWQAALETLTIARPRAIGVPAALAALSLAAALGVVGSLPVVPPPVVADDGVAAPADHPGRPLAPGDLRVHVTPPAYVAREASVTLNPDALTVLEGSLVRLEIAARAEAVQLVDPGHTPIDLPRVGGVFTHTFTATASRILLLQPLSPDGHGARLLQVRVDLDRHPIVQIQAPARDLVVPDATGSVPIEIVAEDDLALDSVVLRYTRVAGSGETFSFQEGDAPLVMARTSPTAWRARTTLALAALKLEDGDTLVYRALARDGKPGRDPSVSDTFIVEIGRLAGVASTGFAVPPEQDRQAISQQMVIIKTERLDAGRAALSAEEFTEQARLLAIEQRMVKAEFVFMTGGHVEDEVAEAEAGHELAEGRLENQAQVELLAAIREMSRAEARLNAADTTQALVFERAALRALQRAFDRRRYLLRTLPERTRIDPARRLTGERRDARGASLDAVRPESDPVAIAARAALVTLAGAAAADQAPSAQVAAGIAAVDPENADLQRAAVTLATAADAAARRAAINQVQRELSRLVHSRIGPAPQGRITADPLDGRLADALQRGKP